MQDTAINNVNAAQGLCRTPIGREEQGPESPAQSAQNGSRRPPLPLNAPQSFGALDVAFQRLNLGEAAAELACCPEEDACTPPSNAVPTDRIYGVANCIGTRTTLEDTYLTVPDLLPGVISTNLYGVFDGHSGVEAAEYARDHLADVLRKNDKLSLQPGGALNSAFLDLDEQFYFAVKDEIPRHESGTTLIAVLIINNQVWVANAGDSRAVLSSRGRAEELSEDHRPNSESEAQRVVALGGIVSDGYLGGHLAVTRSLGDYQLDSLKSKNVDGRYFSGPLTAEPTISCRTIKAEDEYIVLATDGLWDTFSNQRVLEITRQSLQQNDNDPHICARCLVDACIDMNVADNVTVIIICLSNTAPPRRGTADMTRSLSQNGFATLRNAIQNTTAGW